MEMHNVLKFSRTDILSEKEFEISSEFESECQD